MKPHPDRRVVAWLAAVDEDQVFISVVTLAELYYGIEGMTSGSRRNCLARWLRDDLVADAWGKVAARSAAAGRPIGAMDAFIAATAQAHDLILVTRNVSDFEASIKAIINPWVDDSTADA